MNYIKKKEIDAAGYRSYKILISQKLRAEQELLENGVTQKAGKNGQQDQR